MTVIKICGVTRAGDARAAVAAGADLIGVVLWAPSPRSVDVEGAARIRQAVPGDVPLVGVFVDEDPDRIDEIVDAVGLDRVQLHGAEPPEVVRRFGARALRGVRDGDASAVPPGVPVVYDRSLGERPAQAALAAHWEAARALAAERPVLLAGSLDPDNVAAAIAAARPYGVDVARGVEGVSRIKDHDRLRRFVAAAKHA